MAILQNVHSVTPLRTYGGTDHLQFIPGPGDPRASGSKRYLNFNYIQDRPESEC